MQIRTATGPIKAFMRLCKFKGWTSFWGVVYLMPGWEGYPPLIRHEAKHLEQIERLGRLRFALAYLWELLRRGYWNNRFEVEARAAERVTERGGA